MEGTKILDTGKTKVDVKSPVKPYAHNAPAKTAIVKNASIEGDRGNQMPLKSASEALKPGNTVIYHGTAVTVTEANKGTDQVQGMKMFMNGVESGKSGPEALANTTKKYPQFKLNQKSAPPKAPSQRS
jgi:hypothetical protein